MLLAAVFSLLLFVSLLQSITCATAVGLDHLLAQHIAHLFIRDPVSLFAEKVEQDLEKDIDHFEVSQCYSAVRIWKGSLEVEAMNIFTSCALYFVSKPFSLHLLFWSSSHPLSLPLTTEYPVNQLEYHEVQTTATWLTHWVASWVQTYGCECGLAWWHGACRVP